MKTIWTIVFGFVSGIFGGMGMGTGTLLVPLLTLLSYDQKAIQSVNLISFLPMCIVALVFHAKNKLLQTDNTLWITIPAVLFAVVGAMLMNKLESQVLKYIFGGFLVVIGIWQLVVTIKAMCNAKTQPSNENKTKNE